MPVSLLIVDDMEINRMIIKKFILGEYPDFHITTAKNGLEAVEIVNQNLPDLIVMDWEMPYLTGLEATKIIKSNPKTQLIPIIMATSYHSADRLREAFSAGADDFVSSLSTPFELNARISSVLRMNQLYTSTLTSKQEISTQKKIIEQKNSENNRIKRIVYNIFLVYSIVATLTSFLSFHYFKLISQHEKSITKVVETLHDVEHFVVMAQQHLTFRLTVGINEHPEDKKYYSYYQALEDVLDSLAQRPELLLHEKDMLKKLKLLAYKVNLQINHQIATFNPKNYSNLRTLNSEIGAMYIVIRDLRKHYLLKRERTLETVKIINLIMVTITIIVTIFLAASVQFFVKDDSKQSWWFKLFFR